MCGYFCIGFIDFILEGKSLVEYRNLFSPNEYKKHDKTILKYFQWGRSIVDTENLKTLKYHIFKKNVEAFYCL